MDVRYISEPEKVDAERRAMEKAAEVVAHEQRSRLTSGEPLAH